VVTIIDPVDGGRRKSSSSYMFCCEALLSAICTDLLAFCEGVNVFGGSCSCEAKVAFPIEPEAFFVWDTAATTGPVNQAREVA
jgi:hypothetical protein